MNFDSVGAQLPARFDLLRFGINKKVHVYPRLLQASDRVLHSAPVTHDVQATFGGELLPPLRDQADVVGSNPLGKLQHLRGYRHLQVEIDRQSLTQSFNVPLLNVASVFPQVNRDAIGSTLFRKEGGLHRIGNINQPRLAHGGYMVDVDSKTHHSQSYIG